MSGPMAVVHPVHPVHPAHPNTGIRGMASPEGANPVSRLAQMQARFQQKQQQEKEQKLLALYADQAQQAYARINGGGGKVRQLFQERRGLDRSYPLQPLEGRRGTSLDRGQQLRQNTTKRTNSLVRAAPPRYPSAGYDEDDYYYQPPIYTSQQRLDQDYIENNNRFYKQQAKQLQYQQQIFGDENDYFSKSYDLDSTKVFKKLPNIGGTTLAEQKVMMAPAKEQEIRKPATHIRSKTTDPAVKTITKTMAKLTPPSKKPEVKSTQINENKPKVGARRPTPVPISNSVITRPSTASTDKTRSEPKMAQSNRTPPRAASRGPLVANSTTDLKPCKICGRNFAPDRIAAHENICAKSKQKKRKVFDPIKQRLSGTGAEKYLRKGKPPPPPPATQKKNNWRAKHEEFINNIRAAKQAQAHVAAGGKLADLPPPPPMDTSDYIQCPHCGRKFNESAAERHIPKCATMLHNKPKQGSTTRLQQAKKRY